MILVDPVVNEVRESAGLASDASIAGSARSSAG